MSREESSSPVPIVDMTADSKDQNREEKKSYQNPDTIQVQTRHAVYHEKFSYDRFSTIKSAAVGLLDVALIVESASLLRRVVSRGPDSSWYLPLLVLLSVQLGLQLIEGIFLIFLGTHNLENPNKQVALKRLNITSTIFTALIAILNIIAQQIIGDAGLYAPTNTTNILPAVPSHPLEGSGL